MWVLRKVPILSNFYPRSPCGERREVIAEMTEDQSISIHALLAESDHHKKAQSMYHNTISIHALLAESDEILYILYWEVINFYPRSPCGERPWARGSRATYVEFLSTLSLRRATLGNVVAELHMSNFYPRSPCGERRLELFLYYQDNNFYPRSPCGERPKSSQK